jgi:hypothetical protein
LKADPQPLEGVDKPIRLPEHNPELFPLTCAAHHLIPAQASLRDSTLVKWLVHGSVKAQTKDGKGTGKLSHNVGYDVNGSQNGIWLPGPYALRAGGAKPDAPKTKRSRSSKTSVMAGLKKGGWAPRDSRSTELDEEDTPAGGPSADEPGGAFEVEGRTGTADTSSPFEKAPVKCESPFPAKYSYYFVYTVSAMQKINGQYHDAHDKYSKNVKKALDLMEQKVRKFALGVLCNDCKKKNKERTESSNDFPPPRRLVGTLNGLSLKLEGLVKFPASTWKWPMYTSKMAFHYWVYEKDEALRKL